jgi:hypothetical protein
LPAEKLLGDIVQDVQYNLTVVPISLEVAIKGRRGVSGGAPDGFLRVLQIVPDQIRGLSPDLLCRLGKRAHGGAHLHVIGVAPSDLGVGHEIAAADGGVNLRLVDPGRHLAVLCEGAGRA